jgi:hypothetical protein
MPMRTIDLSRQFITRVDRFDDPLRNISSRRGFRQVRY